MKTRVLLAAATLAMLAGCSSVPLSDVPVENREATPATSGTGPVTTQSSVAPVQADEVGRNTIGPANTSRIVYFDYDSYVIKPEFQNVIEAHARFLKANSARQVAVEGHTDERGGREYNLALGQRRAEAVRRALNLLGVADSQVEAVSFGKEKPANAGSGESAWAQNRRAELAYR